MSEYFNEVNLSVVQNLSNFEVTINGYVFSKYQEIHLITFVYEDDTTDTPSNSGSDILITHPSFGELPSEIIEQLPSDVKNNQSDWIVNLYTNVVFNLSKIVKTASFLVWDMGDHTSVTVGSVSVTQEVPPIRLPVTDWDVTVNENQVDLTFTWGIPEDEYQNLRGSEAYIQSDVNCTEETGYPMFLERNFESEVVTNPDTTKYPNYKFYKATATLTKTAFEANSGGKSWSWVTDNLRFIWVRWAMFGKEAYPTVFPCGTKVTSFPFTTSMDVILSGTTTYSDEGTEFTYEYQFGPTYKSHLLNDTVNTYANGAYSKTQIESNAKKLNLVSPIMCFSNQYTSNYDPDTIANKSYISLTYVKKQPEWDPSTAEGQKVKTAYAIFYDESDYGQTADWTNQQLKVPAIFDEATKTYAIQTTGLMYTSWHQPDHMYKVKLFAEDEAGNLASMDHTDAIYGQELRIRVLEKDLPRFGEDPYWISDGAVIGKALSIKPFNLTDTPDATTEYKGNIYRTSGIDNSSFKVYLDGTEIATDHEWGWNARLNNEADPDCRIQGSTEAQYPFELTDLSGGNHTLKYEISDNDGNTATKQSTFMVHAAGPELEITDPAADIDVNTKTYTLKFRAKSTDNVPVTKFVVTVAVNVTTEYVQKTRTIEITNIPAADAEGYINISQAITLYDEGKSLPHKVPNIITVTAYDQVGSTTAVTRTINCDTIPPVIYDVSAENTTINATTGKIKIQFRLIDTSVTDISITQVGDVGGRREVEVGTEVTPTVTFKMESDVPNLPGLKCEYQENGTKVEDLAKTSLGNGQYKFTGVNSKFTVVEGQEKSFNYYVGSDYHTSHRAILGTWAPFIPVNAPTIEVTSYNVIGNTGDIPDLGIDGYMTKSSSKVHVEGTVNGDRTTVEAGKIMVTTKNGIPTTGYTNSSRTLYQRTNGTCTLTSTGNASKPNEYTFSGDIVIPNDVNGFFDLIVGYSADGALGEGDVTANPIRIYRDPADNTKIANLNSFHTSNIDTNMDTATAYRWEPNAQFFWQYGFNSKQFTCTLTFPEAPNETDRSVEVDLPYKSWTAEIPKNIVFEAPSYTYLNQYLPTLDASVFENSTQTEVTKNVPMILRGYMPNVDGTSGKTEIIHRELSLTLKYTRTIKTPTIEATSPSDKLSTESAVRVNALTSITFSGTSTNADRVEYQYFTTTDDTAPDEGASSGDCNLSEDGTWSVSITFRKYDSSSRRAYVKFVAFNGDISTATSTYVFYIPMAS